MWGSHDKPRGASEPRGSALLTELRAALAESEARSEERRLALETHMQDVGFMRIQLRVRNARITALEKEVSALGDALAHRRERSGEVKSDAASLNDTIAALTGTVAERDSRIAALDKEVSALGDALAHRKEQIGEVKSDSASLNDTIAALTGTVAERDANIAALKAMQLAEGETVAARQSDFARAIAETEVQRKNLATLEAALAAANARLAEKEATALAALELRNSTGAAIGKQRQQIKRLEALVAERDADIAALKAVQLAEGETVAARQGDFARAIAETEVQRKNLATLEAALAAANARLAEKEATALAALELRNSTEAAIGEQRQQIARLEVELAGAVRDRDGRIALAEAVQAELLEQSARLATASARVLELEAAALDPGHASSALEEEPRVNRARARDLEADLNGVEDSTHRLEADPQEVGPEDAAPLFIRTGESEVVHVLGRKTTIGRTPENDVQIDAKYISRHHAVILAERTHTIIEDLNSTNGVIVNGRRVMRQALKDGDIVLIGKAPFRFAMRHGTERR